MSASGPFTRRRLSELENSLEYQRVRAEAPTFIALCEAFEADEIASTYYVASMFPTERSMRDALWIARQIGLAVQGAPTSGAPQ